MYIMEGETEEMILREMRMMRDKLMEDRE